MSDFDLASAQPISQGFDLASAKPAQAAPSNTGLSSAANGRSSFTGDMEALGSTLTGALATPIAGISGMGNAILNAGARGINAVTRPLGLPQIPQPTSDAADQVRATMRALQYQPQTQQGQNAAQMLGYLPGKLAQVSAAAGGKVTDLTGSPTLGAATTTALQAAPLLLGTKLPAFTLSARAMSPEAAEATSIGLKLTPEQAGGPVGKAVQGLTGSAKLERSISQANSPVVNNAVAQDLGLSKLTASAVRGAKAAPNAVYDQVSRLGSVPTDAQYQADIAGITDRTGSGSFSFDVPKDISDLKQGYAGVQKFDAADAVAKVRQLRRDSVANLGARYNPQQQALGKAQRQIADALDNQLDRFVQNSGTPDLISQLRDARTRLAQINSAQRAMKGDNIVPQLLSRQLANNVPLSGNMRVVANAYDHFGRSLQDVSKIRDSTPFGVLDLGYGAAAGLSRPAALLAIPARPLARAALASDAYQRYGIQGAPVTLAPRLPSLGPVPGLLAQPAAFQQQQPQGLLR